MGTQDVDAVVRLAKSDPAAGLVRARALTSLPDHPQRVRARWAEGRALFELARTREALDVLEEAAAAAHGRLADRIDVTRSHVLWVMGHHDEAHALLDAVAARATDAVVAALVVSQQGALALGEGRLGDAAALCSASLAVLRGHPDDLDAAARDAGNVAYVRLVAGDLEGSEELLDDARELASRAGELMVEAGSLQGLGYVAGQRGDLPAALQLLSDAEGAYDRIARPGRNLSTLYDDMAEVHRLAGLTREAVQHAQRSVDLLGDEAPDGAGQDLDRLGQAWLRLARCQLDAGDPAAARDGAATARRLFEHLGRGAWADRTLLVLLGEPAVAPADDPQDVARRASVAADALAQHGWPDEAARLRTCAGDVLLRRGARDAARHVLGDAGGRATDVAAADEWSVSRRLDDALGAVLTSVLAGHDVGPALDGAHRILREHQVRLGDPELRAGTARMSARLRWWGVEHQLAGGSAAELLATVERWRATAFDLPRALPPDGDAAVLRDRLRAAEAGLLGGPAEPEDVVRVVALREDLRGRSLRRTWTSTARPTGGADVARAAPPTSALGERVLLEWFEHEGRLHVLRARAGTVEHHDAGPVDVVEAGAVALRRALARMLRPGLPDGVARRRLTAAGADAAALRSALLGPLDPPADEELVVVPPEALPPLPWGLLAPGVPVTVAPSLSAWASRAGAAPTRPVLGVVVGPDLAHGVADAAGLRAGRDGWAAVDLVGPRDADAAALRRALPEVGVLHVAAHGAFHPQSPRFSSLRLADGPFTLYELDELDAPPVVSLAACSAGEVASLPGAELLGLAPAWFAAGADAVLAPAMPVPDEAAATVAGALLGGLVGRTPAAALARLHDLLDGAPTGVRVTAAVTTCFGGAAARVGPPRAS